MTCPDCKASREYVGLFTRGPCLACAMPGKEQPRKTRAVFPGTATRMVDDVAAVGQDEDLPG